MKVITPLTLRERLYMKQILCMILVWGVDTQGKNIYAFASALGHRFIEFYGCIKRNELIEPAGQFNFSIIVRGEGEPTQENYDFMAEKYLFSQDNMNVRIFPGNAPPSLTVFSSIAPDPKGEIIFQQVTRFRIGLLSTFGISEEPERALIIRFAETFRAMSSEPNTRLIYSRKGE